MNRRDFLVGASLPVFWPARRLWSQETGNCSSPLPSDPARTLRDYCIETDLTRDRAAIFCPVGEEFEQIAEQLSTDLAPECGGRLEVRAVAPDTCHWPSSPQNLVLLGNALNNPLIFHLYVNHYTLADEYFPGPDCELVHTVHNPFGDFRNVIVIGSSNPGGTANAARVFLSMVRKHGPKLGFTLHSRSSRMRMDVPAPEDFAYCLQKRKQQIDADDIPWVAMDYGMLYYLTGHEQWGELFRDLHLHAIEVARDHGTWPRTVFDNDFYVYRLLTAWDLIEESPIFSNDDRREITRLCLETSRYVNGMSYLQDYFSGRLRMLNNHQTFPAISIFMAHRYFSKYYGWKEFERTQAAVKAIFAMHNTSWRPNDNDEGVAVRTHRHLVNYSLIQGDDTYFATGRARKLADWIIMVTDNRADTLIFGDAGEYDGAYHGGPKEIQDQYCLGMISLASWYDRDGRYTWARDWFRKGLDWKDRLDFDQLLCKKYGWQERYGITEWEFYLGWLFRDHLKAEEPAHLLGVAVAHYDEAGRIIAKVEELPREESFDKMTFRKGFGKMDEYLAVEGIATMPHSHQDANCIMRLSWRDRLWIVEGDEMKSLRRYHNGIVVVRNGEHLEPPQIARLKASGMLSSWGASQTLQVDDNGLDCERNIFWRQGEYFIVWDRLTAVRKGSYMVECRWRTLGDVEPVGRELQVKQDGESFSILSADQSELALSYRDALYEPDREDYRHYEHAKDGFQRILRGSQRREMKAGDPMHFVNRLQVTSERPAVPVRIAGENIAAIGKSEETIIGMAEQGATVGPLELQARMFVIEPEGIHLFAGKSIAYKGRSLWHSAALQDITVKNPEPRARFSGRTNSTATSAPTHFQFRPAGKSLWQTPIDSPATALHQASGTIAVGDKAGQVHIFNEEGVKKAQCSLPGQISAVCVLPEHVIAGSRGALLAYMDLEGTVLWKRQFNHGIRQRLRVPSALMPFENNVLVGLEDETLFRLDLQGREIWNVHCQYHAITRLASATVSGLPHILVGLEWGTVNMVNGRGILVWSKQFGPVSGLASADLLDDRAQKVLCADWMGISVARAEDGLTLWSANLGGESLDVVPLRDGEGKMTICTASDIGQVACFNTDGTTRWRLDAAEPLTSMAVTPNFFALGCLSGNVQLRETQTGSLRSLMKLGSPIFKLSPLDPPTNSFVGVTEDGLLFGLQP